ncbi:uncharacterized protein LOC116337326 isoform X2 [Contarinia nasturtii]|uniref:uncharacterized protein LOC116337326 isoform X2 n=1 Tax=Contarinia nasturtii TaxID=265458 RepID=UPI0012D3B500|nr:uncharacterized protein LOC116337326 isoform X2 [Contarinia nasturtii]
MRKCRFSDERSPINASFPYGFSSCINQYQVEFDLKNCNCTVHFSPPECIRCTKSSYVLALQRHNYIEQCFSTCTEMIVNLISYDRRQKYPPYIPFNESDTKSGDVSMTVVIPNLPTRLTRQLLFTSLDLVVTIGSIIGLFFGASFLSLAEIIYIWILRRF